MNGGSWGCSKCMTFWLVVIVIAVTMFSIPWYTIMKGGTT
jgi:hypothetical protein